MDIKLETALDRIRQHIKVLNHSSERMASSLNELQDDLGDMSERMASVETNLAWLMKLIWIILGGIIMIVFRMFTPPL